MGFFDRLKGLIVDKVPDLLGDGLDLDLELPAITAILEDVDKIFADGFQFSDIPALITEMVPPLMILADDSELVGATGEERKKFVVDAGTAIYFHYDPDWPFVPNAFGIESRIERTLIPGWIGSAVDAAYKLSKMIKDKVGDGEE